MTDVVPAAFTRTGTPALSRVVARREVAASAHLLAFTGGGGFLPGQNVNLALEPSGPVRSYSVASAPADPVKEVLFDVVPGGLLTPRLAALRPGDPLYVSAAFGGFLDDERPATWIAAGTGVAPFASLVRSGLAADKILAHAGRSPEGFYFRELFAARLGPRYFPCPTRAGAASVTGGTAEAGAAHAGGLLGWLRDHELPPDRRYLLCGSTRMVVAIREQLIARGVPFANILAEIFF
jgi:ferredoxin--NADP+ reductase